MNELRRCTSIILLMLVWAGPATCQQKTFTATDLVQLRMPGSIVISPEGGKVAFTVRQPNLQSSSWTTQVYVVNAADKSVRQLTSSTASSLSPGWSPDGSFLSFVSRREFLDEKSQKHSGQMQLFVLPMAGGEAQPLTRLANGVDEYAWSPDGKSVAILSGEELSPEKEAEKDRREKLKMDWESSLDPKPGKDLWLLDVSSGAVKKITTIDRGAEKIAWSPDSKKIVYQTNYSGEYNDEQKYDIWTVDLAGKKIQLTKAAGPETAPLYSPDGSFIAYITQTVPDIEFAKTELSVMNADGSNPHSLTKDFPYSVSGFQWAPGGRELIARVSEKTHAYLYSVPPGGGPIKKIIEGSSVCSEPSVSRNGTIATVEETPTTLREIVIVKEGKAERLTEYSRQLDGYALGAHETINVKSRDGKYDIEVLLVKPAGFTAGKKYPVMLAYHGGPYGNFEDKFSQAYPVQLLAQEGMLVVMPNVRGSSGYTDAFSQSNRYDLGGGDYRDAMDVIDALITRGIADSTKMGVMGGSYGGFMTNWTISQTQRFRAAVSMYGIFSWFTDWSNSFQPAFEQMYFGYNYWEKPIDMNSLWVNRAPQTFVKNITCPTLILQGTEDQYTNISNSREMYAALKELGRTVEFVVYPRAQHGLRTEPNQYINVLERTVGWARRYVLEKDK